ncbi:terpene cyclase/mutase family protein [Actinoplanes bogorensis]|uniref:Terpene cyclase/mutase family protein n=1 Tax=Paractinoplanes bogorensis TaxID=1610840 RepID=A0ABS5YRC0_9ACTN|nr:prenyltransferase/squalene oxidase repeat-containing protein [Actinoplanes bogorensis]MBU2665979.1 terpene cyclase/mutase family protein [Actinoplanes bogorensis]
MIVHGIDGRTIDALVAQSLDLLRRTYRSGEGDGGGWYHRLDAPTPGPSATAAGLSSFLIHGRSFEHEQECLRFLRSRQVQSEDPLLDGGWAVNTSAGQPVTEATALVARLLACCGTLLSAAGPDARRAMTWLTNNQNDDGGWGAFRGQESRVWVTAMAVRALSELDQRAPAIAGGVRWLVGARDPSSHAWGERPRHPATVTHTSYVLAALIDAGPASADRVSSDVITEGFVWLTSHLDPARVHDDHARLESYNVTRVSAGGSVVMWENTIWHHGLPFALSALVRQPGTVRFDLIAASVHTLGESQLEDGRWPGVDSSATFSVWTIWPFLEALADVKARLPLRSGQVLTPLSPQAAVVQGGRDLEIAPQRLLSVVRWRARRTWATRHWAMMAIGLLLACGTALVATGVFKAEEVGFGLVVPIILLGIQVAVTGRESVKQ